MPDPTENHLDEDVHALENIAGFLRYSTEEEKDAIAAAALRAFEVEMAGPKREEFLQVLGSWMEHIFGDGWEGNQRANQ